MAGSEGIEPPLKVLETLVVTIGPRPYMKRGENDTPVARITQALSSIFLLFCQIARRGSVTASTDARQRPATTSH